MQFMTIVTLVQRLGGLVAYSVLGIILYGIWRGTQRSEGRATGSMGHWLRSPWFYLLSTALFIGLSYFGWRPLPLTISPFTRAGMLTLGGLLYFPGMVLILWGRLVLGKNYFVSTGFGAQLFANHQLITHGPFAIVRHPMYVGLFLAAVGALLIYTTWTTLLFVCFAPLMSIRARREETVLAAEFGEAWQAYCRRVPRFLPRFKIGG